MTPGRRLVRAVLVFGCASAVLLVVTPQLAPGWRAAAEQAPLNPTPTAPGMGSPGSSLVEKVAATVHHADGHSARAWIVTPRANTGGTHVPGVVMVHGAGAAGRGALLAQAVQLARSGVAAIVYDKRTDGYSLRSRDYTRLADDAIDAASVLAADTRVDPSRIGILGFSEGGWVAPIATKRAPGRWAFLVLVSATIVSPLDQVAWAADRPLRSAPDWLRRIPATFLASGRPFVDYLDTDIAGDLKALNLPVYAVWGAEDTSIPVAVAVRTLIQQTRVPVAVRLLPGTGHDPGTGAWVSETTTWIDALPATARAEITGAEPSVHLGLAELPSPVWYLQPLVHALLTLSLAVGSWSLPPAGRAHPRNRATR